MSLSAGKLQKPVRKLRKLLKKFPRKPSPDLVHDLRTRMRRAEAMAQALHLDSRRNERRLLKVVKPLRRRAGKVRDMDVLTGLAARLHPDGEQGCLVELLEHLGAERDRTASKLHRAVSSRGPEVRRRLKKCSRLVGKALGNGKQQSKANEWPADAMALAVELSSELARWPRLDAHNLHPFRLKVKELRYTLQLADKEDAAFVKILGEVKDTVGEWHDWQELGTIAEGVLDHGPGCEVLRLIASIARAKFHEALSLANQMRQQYLEEPERRGKKKRQPKPRLKEQVLEATSALAA